MLVDLLGAVMVFLGGVVMGEHEQILNEQLEFGVRNGTWFPYWKWWNSNNWRYENRTVDWLMRYPFSFLKDGYHFTGTAGILLVFGGTAIYSGAAFWDAAVIAAAGYVVFGTGFNVSYHDWDV